MNTNFCPTWITLETATERLYHRAECAQCKAACESLKPSQIGKVGTAEHHRPGHGTPMNVGRRHLAYRAKEAAQGDQYAAAYVKQCKDAAYFELGQGTRILHKSIDCAASPRGISPVSQADGDRLLAADYRMCQRCGASKTALEQNLCTNCKTPRKAKTTGLCSICKEHQHAAGYYRSVGRGDLACNEDAAFARRAR